MEAITDAIKSIFYFIVQDKNYEWIFSGIGCVLVFTLILNGLCGVFKIIWRIVSDKIRKYNAGTFSFDKIIENISNPRISDGVTVESDFDKLLNVKRIIEVHFPEYKDFLVIRYGSSVMNKSSIPNDYDFIVLLLGYSSNHELNILQVGDIPEVNIPNLKEVDIVFRDYSSFLFALVSGMPYEHSVIKNGQIVQGHKGYFLWLKRIAKNILIDRDFLCRRYENEKISSERIAWNNSLEYGNQYAQVRAAYFYLCSLIQLKLIKNMDKVLFYNDVAKLGNVKELGNELCDEFDKEVFSQIVNSLKRRNVPRMDKKFIFELETLIKKLTENVLQE